MDLSTSLVDLDSIDVQPKEYNFNPEIRSVEIEHLAHSIVKLQGLLTIPIVKRTGVESYELLSGYLEYYATLKARELDPQLPDRLRVFIVDEESLNIALEQVDAIEKISKVKPSPGDKTQLQLDNIISILQKMQSSIPEKISTDIQQSNSKILEKIDSRIPKPLPALAAFNQILEPEVYRIVINKMAFIGDKKATKIADKLVAVKKQDPTIQFNTFHDVLKALGRGLLSKEKMLEVIDQWD
jgi:hypothetical protein